MQLQIESVHVSCFPTLSVWNASRYASALSCKKICQWNKEIFLLTSKQTNKILIWQLSTTMTLHSSQTDKGSDTMSYQWAKCTHPFSLFPTFHYDQEKFSESYFDWWKKCQCQISQCAILSSNVSLHMMTDTETSSFLRKGSCSQFLGTS